MKKLFLLILCLLCSTAYSQAPNRPPFAITQMQFSPDGKKMAVGLNRTGRDGKQVVRLFDVESGQLLWTRDAEAVTGSSIAFSPDGTQLAVSGKAKETGRNTNGIASIWSVEGGQQVLPVELATGETVDNLLFSPDGKQLVGCVNRYEGPRPIAEIRLWNAQTGKFERTIHSYPGTTYNLSMSVDGKRMMASHSKDSMALLENSVNRGHLTLWELPEFKLVRTMGVGQFSIRFPALSPDGKTFAFEGAPVREQNTLTIWEVNAPTLRPSELPTPMAERLAAFQFTSDGKELVVTGESVGRPRQARLWVMDVAKSRVTRTLQTGSMLASSPLAVSPDGKSLAILTGPASIELRSVQDGKVIRKYE